MSRSAFFVGVALALMCAAAFWVDGALVGDLVIGAATVGIAAHFQTRHIEEGWLRATVACSYVASMAVVSLAGSLLSKAFSVAPPATLISVSAVFASVVLAWAYNAHILRMKRLSE